jgi:uncharacterized protein (TIGR00297 family)
LCAGAIALVAYRAHALTRGGTAAAFAVGTLTYATGGIGFTLVLLAFFVPSVALSRLGRARKRALVDIGKGGPRDALQVLANGGIATACALAAALAHDPRWAVAFAGAYAAATADTWATEIGTLARGRPRSLLTGRPIAAGLSGGITIAGTLAQCAGAIWLAVVAALLIGPASSRWVAVAVAVAGIAGATADSLLGGSLQELRRCDACGRTCETDPHACGAPTRRVRGIPHVTNDVVNLLATGVGALAGFVFA